MIVIKTTIFPILNYPIVKLLYITPYYKPSWYFGGPPRCIAEQAELLIRYSDYTIDVLTLNLNGNKKLFDSRKTVKQVIDGVTVHYLPHTPTPFYNYFLSRHLSNYADRLKDYDVVHIHGVFNAFSSMGMQMAKAQKIPYIVTPHGMLDRWCVNKSKFVKLMHSTFIDNRLLAGATSVHFTTINEQNNSILPSTVGSHVIPYLLQLEQKKCLPKPAAANEKIRAFFLGRINVKKGLIPFLESISLLKEKEKNKLVFDIYGNDEEGHLKEVLQVISKHNLGAVVKYKGFISPERRSELLKDYDVMVLTSYQENFGITVLESLQEFVPVFISDKVNLHDWIKKYDCGWITTTNKKTIATSLQELLETPLEDIRKKGNNGVKLLAHEMDVKKLVSAYQKMYKSVLQQHLINK